MGFFGVGGGVRPLPAGSSNLASSIAFSFFSPLSPPSPDAVDVGGARNSRTGTSSSFSALELAGTRKPSLASVSNPTSPSRGFFADGRGMVCTSWDSPSTFRISRRVLADSRSGMCRLMAMSTPAEPCVSPRRSTQTASGGLCHSIGLLVGSPCPLANKPIVKTLV